MAKEAAGEVAAGVDLEHADRQGGDSSRFVGMGVGAVLYFKRDGNSLEGMRLLQQNFVNLFMILLLPMIIFHAGYNINKVRD